MWASDVPVWNSKITVRFAFRKSRSPWCSVTLLCRRLSDFECLIPFLFPFSHFSHRNCGWTQRHLHPKAFAICAPIVESRQARRPTSGEQTSPWSPVLSVELSGADWDKAEIQVPIFNFSCMMSILRKTGWCSYIRLNFTPRPSIASPLNDPPYSNLDSVEWVYLEYLLLQASGVVLDTFGSGNYINKSLHLTQVSMESRAVHEDFFYLVFLTAKFFDIVEEEWLLSPKNDILKVFTREVPELIMAI